MKQALQDAEHLQATLLANLGLGVIIHGPRSEVQACNPKAAELLGLAPEQLLGRQAGDAIWRWLKADGTAMAPDQHPASQVLATGATQEGQTIRVIQPGSGLQVWCLLNAFPVLGPDRQVLQAVVTFMDLGPLAAAQREAETAFTRFRQTTQEAPAPIMIHAEDGEVLTLNQAWTEFTGYTLEDIPTIDQWVERAHGDQSEKYREVIADLFGLKERTYSGVHTIRTRSGRLRHWDFSSAPLDPLEDGRRVVMNMAQDVTALIEAQQAHQASEQRFRNLFENMLEGCVHGEVLFREGVATDLLFLDVNQAFETLTGWKGIVGRKASAVLPDVQAVFRDLLPILERVVRQGTSERREVRLGALDLWVALEAYSPGPGFFVAMFEDITHRKWQEMLGRETEALAAKSQMAAYVAHEINGPMAGIKSAFTLLKTAIPREHAYHPYVDLVDREIDRVTAIVRMMYGLYRPGEARPRKVEVATVLQDIATLLAPRFRSHQVTFLLDGGEPGLRGVLHENLLRQVLFNLLQNAVEATPPKGTVRCSAWREGPNLKIQVSDGGPGIPPEIAERVWEPGFTTKQNAIQGGLGLGLSTCRRLLDGLQGSISFENPAGGGCLFTVRIPLEWESGLE